MTFNPILFYEYGKNRGVINHDIYDIQVALNNATAFSGTPMVMWFKPYLASLFPEITCDKTYIFLYSTDHKTSNIGGIYWGKGNNLNCSDFVEQGLIIDVYQAESPQLVRIPSSICGDSDVIHLYYHTNTSDPTNSSRQQSHLITTAGGLLHTTTWTQRGLILGGTEAHTGYLKVYEKGISTYQGIHILAGGVPQEYGFSASTTGRLYTRINEFNRTFYLPIGFQYKPVTGIFIIDLYNNNWYIGNVVPVDFVGDTTFCLIKLNANLQPKQFCINLNNNVGIPIVIEKSYGDLEVYIENSIAYLYWTDGVGSVKFAKYNLSNLLNYPDTSYPLQPEGTISFYDFNNNTDDPIGNNFGTPTSLTYFNDAEKGIVGNFSGVNTTGTKVITTNSDDFKANNIGVELYFKTSAAGTGARALIVKALAWGIYVDGGVLKIYQWAATAGFKATTVNLNDNLWHKIKVEFRNGVTDGTLIYVDDVLKLTTTYAFSAQTRKVVIGNGNDDNNVNTSQEIKGYIKDVRIYNLP